MTILWCLILLFLAPGVYGQKNTFNRLKHGGADIPVLIVLKVYDDGICYINPAQQPMVAKFVLTISGVHRTIIGWKAPVGDRMRGWLDTSTGALIAISKHRRRQLTIEASWREHCDDARQQVPQVEVQSSMITADACPSRDKMCKLIDKLADGPWETALSILATSIDCPE